VVCVCVCVCVLCAASCRELLCGVGVCKSRGMIARSNNRLVSVTCCSGINKPFL
jgi:hypothetical protein